VCLARANREAIQQISRHKICGLGVRRTQLAIAACLRKRFEKRKIKRGADKMQAAVQVTTAESARESRTITRRIGSTDFEISVFFSDKSKETLNDKIKRLIKSETGRGVKSK
jgi:uncharacterized OsmC-like protein